MSHQDISSLPTGWLDRAGGILRAATFLTRLPLPVPLTAAQQPLAKSLWAFPVVGGVIGLVGAVVLWLARDGLGVALPVAALLAMAGQMALTGALHEDGLADVADGFGGGATAERKLAIMRDSRIGAYGATTLLVALGLRWTAISTLPYGERLADLVVAGVCSRAMIPLVMALLAPARSDGLGAGAGTPDRRSVAVALAMAVVSLAWLPLASALPMAVGVVAVTAFLTWLARHQIGGYTGDVLGAVAACSEVVALVILSGHR